MFSAWITHSAWALICVYACTNFAAGLGLACINALLSIGWCHGHLKSHFCRRSECCVYSFYQAKSTAVVEIFGRRWTWN